MRVVCLHKDAVRRLKELGADVRDLTPLGLDGTPYHLITATAEQAAALRPLNVKHEDVTPKVIANLPAKDLQGFLYCRGGKIPNGTKLRNRYKTQTFEAQVRGGYIWLEGNKYDNPSYAAKAIGHGSVNGWTSWEYYDEGEKKWFLLDRLRKKIEKAPSTNHVASPIS